MTPLLIFFLVGALQVRNIEVEGTRWTSPEYVISRSGLSKGKFSPVDVSLGIRRLYKDGFFKSISVFAKPVADSVFDITIQVEENPRLGKLSIEGLKHLNRKKLRDSLSIKKGMYVSNEKIFSWQRKIEELLKGKGYYMAEVSAERRKSQREGFVDIILKVKEGPPVRIKEIEVIGNKSFSDKILESLLRNREKNWHRKGKFKENYWYEDLVKIEKFYHNHGFPWASVDSTTKELKDGWLYLNIYVTEGKRVHFGDIHFEGNTVFDTSFLYENIALIPPKPTLKDRYNSIFKGIKWDPTLYNEERLQKAVTEIAGLYADSGYLYVQVFPEKNFKEDTIVDITFRIKENYRMKVRLVDIRGNKKTHDPVIRREIVLYPGDYFSKTKLIQSQRNLFFLNYFSNVSADFRETPDTTHIDLIFHVEEKSVGQLGLGATYSQYEGPGIYFQMQEPNFQGRGQSVSAMVQYTSKSRNYQLSFTEPWYRGRPISVGFDIHDYMRYYPQFKEWRQGGSVSYSRLLWNRYSRISFTYTIERQRLFDLATPEKYANYQMVPALASLTTRIVWDRRDRSFNATRGSRLSYEFEISGGLLGGEYFPLPIFVILAAPYSYELSQELAKGAADFHLHILEGIQYVPIFNKLISVSRVKAGFVSGFIDYNKVPFTRLFWLGDIGPFGLRGYSYASIGPGRLFPILSQELRYRASETFYIGIFADAGQVWSSWQNSNFTKPYFRSFKRSVGIGFRIEVPMMGVLGIDFAYGLDNPPGARWHTHFQLGAYSNF